MRMVYDGLYRVLSERNMNVADLREKSGISLGAMMQIAIGENIPVSDIDKICSFLECDPDQIIQYTDKKETPKHKNHRQSQCEVEQYNRYGTRYIKSFPSASAAARHLRKSPSAIIKCVKLPMDLCGNVKCSCVVTVFEEVVAVGFRHF